ncbi:MAG: YitT family protein [Dechloromonas sp.]|uniref:YitT family protein n=1 Tax=Dechloromonas sp. CZR5 TaxID=2608630 RepID=UPI00123E04EA|nr:YitT family protein [Dechloromonas sp. CZR5]MBL8405246.1 YitT family protein [Dechloromonas sp.]
MTHTKRLNHNFFEDAQAILVAPLIFAFAVMLFREAGLLTGGTVGIAFLAHYLSGWSIGSLLIAINLPFYGLALRAMGKAFTIKTFLAVGLLALYTELLPGLIQVQGLNRLFAAVMGGFLAGISLLMLIRHKASLGGLGILVIHLQNTRGWRAGKLQMAADCIILLAAIFIRDPLSVGLSIVGALALNLVIAVNHKAGRYMGT